MVSLAPLWRQVGKDCSSIHFSRPYCYAGASCQSAMPPYSLGVDTLTLLAGITPIHCSWELRLRSAASGVVRGGWPWPCMHGGPEGGSCHQRQAGMHAILQCTLNGRLAWKYHSCIDCLTVCFAATKCAAVWPFLQSRGYSLTRFFFGIQILIPAQHI
jgi:hypothetical protein